jgi:hypothetical protein
MEVDKDREYDNTEEFVRDLEIKCFEAAGIPKEFITMSVEDRVLYQKTYERGHVRIIEKVKSETNDYKK